MKVLIVVTHLLGAGHLTRAAALARGIAGAGHDVVLVSGGVPAPHIPLEGIEVVQLPPVRSDGTAFTTLIGPDGPVTEGFLEARRQVLCAAAREAAADVVITELFPFGRRVLSAEFLALLEAARAANPRVRVLSSVRDILSAPSSEKKAARTEAVLLEQYDGVLVHSDPAIVPLEASWPVTPALSERLLYTGFVVGGAAPAIAPERNGEVLVSAGGGSVGRPVFEAALAAARMAPELNWRILVGGHDAGPVCDRLNADTPENVLAEPVRPDFRALLAWAGASVSLAGYNTAMDLMLTGVPAVLVPFDAAGETEQALRARRLAQLSGIEVLASAELRPEALLAALRRVMEAAPRPTEGLAVDGVAETVRVIEALEGAA